MQQDSLLRFLFADAQVRGELVQLQESYQAILSNHQYPAPIQKLLGELMVASSLLTATLKFEGEIAVQLQGDGPVRLAVINGSHDQRLRGVARYHGEIPEDAGLHELMGKGHLVITITPNEGDRYQGVVGLEGDNLAQVLEHYFNRSEQLPTKLWIHADDQQAAGMLLQVMPAGENGTDFEHLVTLTDTIKREELFTLDAETILHRLYHQEEVRLFEPQPVRFHCVCSRERCADALVSLGKEEIDHILAEKGKIEMNCEYCRAHYEFDKVDATALFCDDAQQAPKQTQ
ncbi:Hsp33 family molecular chaperone HslO [Gallaecimonas sp. GXIMD4217]|uniref:Hsp33 family molecular chaperone HslO n=1 Tax=Gallaecimonas sp. GXIMD4217 TaxID=3131927 RepID=UPI00311B24DA